jgi:hypothetical protein
MTDAMPLLDLDALAAAPPSRDPFEFVVVPRFVAPAEAAAIRAQFPAIPHAGLTPVSEVEGGPAFDALIDALGAPALTQVVADKFGIDLAGRPLMLTVRAQCQAKDGRIHTDSLGKLVTALLYFNEAWEAEGGRLRLLRGPERIDDYAAEVAPVDGTLVLFRRSERSFHGHLPHLGPRRYVMANWMADNAVARREIMRHRLSTRLKRLFA